MFQFHVVSECVMLLGWDKPNSYTFNCNKMELSNVDTVNINVLTV